MTQLDDIIKRLEKAAEGSRSLDRAVTDYLDPEDARGRHWGLDYPHLTSDLNAALALVEEKLASLDIYLTKHRKEGCGAELVYVRNRLPRSARSEGQATLPLALLIALLTALKEQNNG